MTIETLTHQTFFGVLKAKMRFIFHYVRVKMKNLLCFSKLKFVESCLRTPKIYLVLRNLILRRSNRVVQHSTANKYEIAVGSTTT